MSLTQRIRARLANEGRLKARELASQLGVAKDEVNRVLYGELAGAVRQDADSYWHLVESPSSQGTRAGSASDVPTSGPPPSRSSGSGPAGVPESEVAPTCPKCGKGMRRQIARRGSNAGNAFWGCLGFPNCRGTLPIGGECHDEPRRGGERGREHQEWREAKPRRDFEAEYVPIGAVSGLHELSGLDDRDELHAQLSQTLFLWSHHAEGDPPFSGAALGFLAVAEKILTRGSHALVSLRTERAAIERLGLLGKVADLGKDSQELGFVWNEREEPLDRTLLARREAFVPCDDLNVNARLLDSELEVAFIHWLTSIDPSLPQWLTPQVSLGALVSTPDALIDARRADFLLYRPGAGSAIVVEIDGEEHEPTIDRVRDEALQRCGLRVIRIPNVEVKASGGPKLDSLREIVSAPEWRDSGACTAIAQLALNCCWAAKLQLAILRGVRRGMLETGGGSWRIDVTGPLIVSDAAVWDLLELLDAIETLYGGGVLPARVHLGTDSGRVTLERDDNGWTCREALGEIDERNTRAFVVALEPYQGPYAAYPQRAASVIVRPAMLPVRLSLGHLPGADALLPVVCEASDGQLALRQVLRWVFRKKAFREGQAKAVLNALRGIDSIVLLPTGGGKSLIYQLSGLLVPGATIVIDPIVALIEDQIAGMRRYGIDRAVGISSSVGSAEELRRLQRSAERGECLFILVAPERLQSPAFRDALRALSSVSRINFAVIDEAHCVSEWGHDFRTSYLNLGRNLRRLGTGHGRAPTLLALTGTASRAVLRDMIADLAIDTRSPEAVIRPESFDRRELEFRIVPTTNRNRTSDFRGVLMSLPGKFGVQPGRFWSPHGRRTMSGIVFSPFAKGRESGVLALRDSLRAVTHAEATVYSGGPPSGEISANAWNLEKRSNAKAFMDNDVVALVATKAFGIV